MNTTTIKEIKKSGLEVGKTYTFKTVGVLIEIKNGQGYFVDAQVGNIASFPVDNEDIIEVTDTPTLATLTFEGVTGHGGTVAASINGVQIERRRVSCGYRPVEEVKASLTSAIKNSLPKHVVIA